MSHPPFDSWIYTEQLGPEQSKSLQDHLASCAECRQLQQSWQAVHKVFQMAPMQSPQIGFTNRWKENLEERRLLQEKLQVRRFILFTVSISVLISFVLILITAFTASPANWLVALIRNFTDLSIHWNQTQSTVSFYLRALPPIIPISLWIILTSGFSLLTLAWIGTMWRISKQGVYSK